MSHFSILSIQSIDVCLQIGCLRKWFTTGFTFVIFVAFMNCEAVLIQILSCCKWFATRFTIEIFLAFMNSMDVFLQISCIRKWFLTWFTFVIFVTFMNRVEVFFYILWVQKMIYRKIHICNLCDLNEQSGCVSSNYNFWKIIFHMIHICVFSFLFGSYQNCSLNCMVCRNLFV